MKRQYRALACGILVASLALIGCKAKPAATLTIEKSVFAPGETITVKYTALPTYDSSAWIGIIPAGVPHGSEAENDRHDVTYQYLKKSTAGNMTFTAPTQPGSYDMRMHDTDSNGMEVASVTFSVSGPTPAATLKTPAAPAASSGTAETAKPAFTLGEEVFVEWKGSWWPAKITAMREGTEPFKIHYDGYSASWDEWIGMARIRKK